MDGSLTQLRRHRLRAEALRAMIDAPPAGLPSLASVAGFGLATHLFEGERRRDVIDTAVAVLGRERSLHIRVLVQAGIGVLLTVCFATSPTTITHLMAIVAAVAAAPTWVLALGAPDAIAAFVLTVPIFGAPARELLHARLLSALALFLGVGAEPPLARAIAERFVGAPLSDRTIALALSPSGSARNVALREESEGALLRASRRLERTAQIRVRFLYLGITAVTLAGVFAPAVREATRVRRATPEPTRIEEEDRPAILLIGTDGVPR